MRVVDGPFGATIPVEVGPPSTPDADFEALLEHSVRLAYPGLECRRNYSIPNQPHHICPDVVVIAPGTSEVFLVADAKRRQRIARSDVEQVARYRGVTRARRCAVFYPVGAAISGPVIALAKQLDVDLVPIRV